MEVICASVIVVIPVCVMMCFMCDWLHDISRNLDRTPSTMFRIEQHMDAERIKIC